MATEVIQKQISSERLARKRQFRAGVASGELAGLIMGAVLMLYSATLGNGFFTPLKNIAATFLGVNGLMGGAGAIVLGLLIHLVVSAAFGVIFAQFARPGTSTGAAVAEGILFGAVIWAVMTFIVLPVANRPMAERVAVIPGAWFITHLIFGAGLSLSPFLERRLATRGRLAAAT